jgi:hypothetical protein
LIYRYLDISLRKRGKIDIVISTFYCRFSRRPQPHGTPESLEGDYLDSYLYHETLLNSAGQVTLDFYVQRNFYSPRELLTVMPDPLSIAAAVGGLCELTQTVAVTIYEF